MKNLVRTPRSFLRIRAVHLLLAAALVVLTAGGTRPAQAFVVGQLPTLSDVCKTAEEIAVVKVEKFDRDKKAIVYSKVRDLKGTFPGPAHHPTKELAGVFTVILRDPPKSFHPADLANQDQLDEAVLALSAEGKTAVIFQKSGLVSVCVGRAWYTFAIRQASERIPQRGAADSRFSRIFCGEVEELIAAVTDIAAGKEVVVPRMVGSNRMLNDRTAPIRRRRADRADSLDMDTFGKDRGWGQNDYLSPFLDQGAWATHRGNPQRTGADDGPGPKAPKVLWVHKSDSHFIAPLVPGARDLYASSLGAFNSPGFHALALDPAGEKQLRWAMGAPLLRQPIAGAPALLQLRPEMQALVFGDGFHTDEGSSLRCVRASDGFPLWQLPVAGKLVHFEGTPTVVNSKLYVGGGNAGVLCLEPGRVMFEGKEQDLALVQAALDQRWKELHARYSEEKKKDPEFALPPDEAMLPRATPRRIWQQGQERWHVDAPVAVLEESVLAASAYLDDEKYGERALVRLKAGDGEVLWTAPLKFNPWAGPTVGPYVIVGCSSIRMDPKAVADARGEVVAVELDTGKVKWRKEVPGGVLSSVSVKAGMAIFTATDGKVRAWDAFTGQEKWAYDARTPFFAGPAVANNMIYVADLKGVVHALNLTDGKPEWTLDLGKEPATRTSGMVYGSPIVHRGRLYLATCNLGAKTAPSRNVVACIGEK
jgi:outer membrane protein assembly factor BamB